MPIRTQFDFIEMVSLNGETGIRSYRSSDLKHMFVDAAGRKFWRLAACAAAYVLHVRTTVRDTLSDWESARQP